MTYDYSYVRNTLDGDYSFYSVDPATIIDVVAFVDFTTDEPNWIHGNYYINRVSGIGSNPNYPPGREVIAGYIYLGQANSWKQIEPTLNKIIHCLNDDCVYQFNGTIWKNGVYTNLTRYVMKYLPGKEFILDCIGNNFIFKFTDELSAEDQTYLEDLVEYYRHLGA